MKLLIKTKNIKEYKQAVAYMYAVGYTYDDIDTYSDFHKNEDVSSLYKEYPYILLDSETKRIDFSSITYGEYDVMIWIKDFDKIEKLHSKTVFQMELTDDYKANVDEDGIHVGCQTISFDKFYELTDLVEMFHNQ